MRARTNFSYSFMDGRKHLMLEYHGLLWTIPVHRIELDVNHKLSNLSSLSNHSVYNLRNNRSYMMPRVHTIFQWSVKRTMLNVFQKNRECFLIIFDLEFYAKTVYGNNLYSKSFKMLSLQDSYNLTLLLHYFIS